MGYSGDDRHRGGDRWRDRDGYEREQGRGGPGGGYGRGGDDDRGFFDRAGDEVRSWFGDDDAQHRREMDQRRWEQEQRMTGRLDNDSGGYSGGESGDGFGGGWGNQRGESWHRDRPGERGWSGAQGEDRGGGERHYGRGEREGWFTDSRGGERGERYGGSGGSFGPSGSGRASHHEHDRLGRGQSAQGFGGDTLRGEGSGRGGLHDPHYSEWRRRQIEDLDRDYDEFRREHQSRFEAEFGSWRSKRQGQRQSLGRVSEQMEVCGSDGTHLGTVDKVRGDRIILTKSDPAAGGIHHSIPCSWVEKVEDKVTLNKTTEAARSEWRDEERSRALFEREGQGSDGPHTLNRSFSGTYRDDEAGGAGPRGDRNDS